MHELSIAYNLVEIAVDAVKAADAVDVKSVHVRIGALAGVVEDALRFGWDVATEGTILAGAALVVHAQPVVVECAACGQQSTLDSIYPLYCSHCFGPAAVISGRELELSSIEIVEPVLL
ncbi:hydrogenase maturation nickel metallochaperone HypA [bacterium]|nr:hydrogenase maturation nickel metallochaperone HypA [bacterium]